MAAQISFATDGVYSMLLNLSIAEKIQNSLEMFNRWLGASLLCVICDDLLSHHDRLKMCVRLVNGSMAWSIGT